MMSKDQMFELKLFLKQRLDEGVALSALQKEVNEKFSCKLTFMELRVIASELDGIDWSVNDPRAAEKAKEEAKRKAEEEKKQAQAAASAENPEAVDDADENKGAAGKTVVTVSKIARPGVAMSGTVQFISGSTAEWYLDATGRLGLENLQGERPTQEDIMGFQEELQRALSGMGN